MSHSPDYPPETDGLTFFTVCVEGRGAEEDFVQIFFAWADDISVALANVAEVARDREGIADPILSEADEYDFSTLPAEVKEIPGTSVYTSGGRFYFPAGEPMLRLPRGVILSCTEGDYDPEGLQPGFHIYQDGELHHLECVVDDGQAAETFAALVHLLPDITVSWVECSDEWDGAGVRQLFTNEALNTPEAVQAFLQEELDNILHNGLVKFTVYSRTGQTNLLLDDHKMLCVMTYSQDVVDAMAAGLENLGFERKDDLKTITRGLYHWHYWPAGALSRQGFIHHLQENGFSLWKDIRT